MRILNEGEATYIRSLKSLNSLANLPAAGMFASIAGNLFIVHQQNSRGSSCFKSHTGKSRGNILKWGAPFFSKNEAWLYITARIHCKFLEGGIFPM